MLTPDRPRFSVPLTTLMITALLIGLVLGALAATSAVSEVPEHRPEDNAVLPHIVMGAVVLVVAVTATILTRSLRWLQWPVSAQLGHRFSLTFRRAGRSPLGILRCVAATILMAFISYLILRMGFQLTAGMNPALTINAWGGPTALGAFTAHGVDAIVCVGLTCLALHGVLRRAD